jgi:predicted  nucleic acid-binding Zn-ribbon protein
LNSIISDLKDLQEINCDVIAIEKERNAITDRIQRMNEIHRNMEQEIRNKEQKLHEAERWYNEKEKEIKEDQEKIKKSQSRLNALTKTKEFVLIQREIEGLKKANQLKEDEMLKLLHAIDEFKSSLEEERKKHEDLRETINREEEANKERIEELNNKLKSHDSRKKEAEGRLSYALLKKYQRIQNACSGIAVAEVVHGSCLGCNRSLPPQLFNTLLVGETVENCPFCNRFIYVKNHAGYNSNKR